MSLVGQQLEINTGSNSVRTLTFAENGRHLLCGNDKIVRVWRVRDGNEIATMSTGGTRYLAVSKNGRWIAVGASSGRVLLWDAQTYDKVFDHEWRHAIIFGVDFSPDSTRFVVASDDYAATVWDIATRQIVLQLKDETLQVRAAKYSPQGDQIATATSYSVRVWDSTDGHLLLDVKIPITGTINTGLLWSDDHLFVVSGQKIKRLDASTGSLVSEWPISEADWYSCIALPHHGEFIACSTNHTITFWNTSTHAQLARIEHDKNITSLTFSPDSHTLAFCGDDGKIIIKNLSRVCSPDVQIDRTILGCWRLGHFADAEVLLTAVISASPNPNHHLFHSRALIRIHLKQWDAAIADAEKSIKIRPSVLGYIAKSTALAFTSEKHKAYRACDIAFDLCDSSQLCFLLLVKAIIVFIAGEHEDALSRIDDLISIMRSDSVCCLVQAHMYLLIGHSHMEGSNYEDAIRAFKRAQVRLASYVGDPFFVISLISGWKFDNLGVTIRQSLCEALFAIGRMKEAGETLLEIVNTLEEEVYMNRTFAEWASDFTCRLLSTQHNLCDEVQLHQLSLVDAAVDLAIPGTLLREWAKMILFLYSWRDALNSAATFLVPRFVIYRALCDHLETADRKIDLGECLQEMAREIATEDTNGKQARWAQDVRYWCCAKLEYFGDTAITAEKHDVAISSYSAALSLKPVAPQTLLAKRSQVHAANKSWKDALNDANEVIELDPSSPCGYERRCVALRGGGNQKEMMVAFETTLSKMSESLDPDVRARWDQCTKTREAVYKAIQVAIQDSPRVLLNTASGRLCDKSEQASAFESSPVFTDLVFSMATEIDYSRVEEEVTSYYRYATFSHKWEPNEPLFENVSRVVVYELDESATHNKLRMFCQMVRQAGFNWAWSDTCCINRGDHVVLQEAIVAMFKWYEGSSLTIVFLRGVRSPAPRGALVNSIWNSRAWTYQEYYASKVVRFYTEDWKPYLDLDMYNHKKSPEIILEMEEATRISAQVLIGLRPGLDDIRTKLCIASHRETTLVEDAAYSLLGIFSVSLPVVYGEGNKSLGRLLAQLITNSGDTSILAWTGTSGSFNSCLPAHISVFKETLTTYIPPAIDEKGIDMMTTSLRGSSVDLGLVMKLYDQLAALPVPTFTGQRMKLPCVAFKLGHAITRSKQSFRAYTEALGMVEIQTNHDLSQFGSLRVVHPWIDFLLDRQSAGGTTETDRMETEDVEPALNPSSWLTAPFGLSFTGQVAEPIKQKRALKVLARLRQPFGALLLAPSSGGVAAFRRIATGSHITVRVVDELTPAIMRKLIDGVRIVDVL